PVLQQSASLRQAKGKSAHEISSMVSECEQSRKTVAATTAEGKRGALGRVVEDDSQCGALAATYRADAMAHASAVIAALARHRPFINSKQHGIALQQRHNLRSRLHARALLGQDELAALEVMARLAQQNRHLDGKGDVAIEVLVQP